MNNSVLFCSQAKYQTGLLHVTEALMDLCKEQCVPVAEKLFVINFTVYSMPTDDEKQFMALCECL